MTSKPVAPPFPLPLKFPDVDPAVLADEDREAAANMRRGPWQLYLRRVLPPGCDRQAD
jgi:hypothetical protein